MGLLIFMWQTSMRHASFFVVAISLAVIGTDSRAFAHGRESSLGLLVFHPADPNHIVARGTWGFVTTRDGGDRWTWQCADAVPFDRLREDPSMIFFSSGRLVAATFDGIFRSDPTQCVWSETDGTRMSSYVTDVFIDPSNPTMAWAVSSPGPSISPDMVYRSDDEGVTWTMVAMPHPNALTDRIRVAASDPMRIYTSGVLPAMGGAPRTGLVLRSDDRGATFRSLPIEFMGDERTVHLLGIDPMNADRVFVRVTRRVTDLVPERLMMSEDGGVTWTTVLELLEIVGFAMSDDGQNLWAGSWDGGLYRSTDRGLTFTALDPSLRVRCLAHRPGELWLCLDNFVEEIALARSSDEGETIEPIWAFDDVENDIGCPPQTTVGERCPMFWPDLALDLQLPPERAFPDGSWPYGDAGMGTGRPKTKTCACVAVGASREGTPWYVFALLGVLGATYVQRSRRVVRRSLSQGRRPHGEA